MILWRRPPALAVVLILLIIAGQARAQGRGQAEGEVADAPAPPSVEAAAPGWQQKLDVATRQVQGLNQAQANVEPGPEIERLRKQIELQQKQIETLLQMTQLLAEQVKKQAPAGAPAADLQERVAAQEAHAEQAARRDQELARAHDELAEALDNETRNGPTLPATLREQFLPTRTNESPLAIYGSVAQDFRAFSGQNSSFNDRSLMIRPYLMLNEKWMMSANVALQIGNVQLFRAQLERFLNDNWTVVVGRFYSPVGFFSERLRLQWVIKTPDPPLLFGQVYPLQLSFDGVQLRGARYLGDWPVKLEYAGFVANGLSVQGANLTPILYSNLGNFRDDLADVNSAKAFGGRLGLSFPKIGVIAGLSGLANNSYDQAGHVLDLWDFDANWHRGNWDARFEYAHTNQTTPASPIRRSGLYAQLAYRRYDSHHPIFQKLEYVFRFDHVDFGGINVASTGINFGGLGQNLANMPLDRNRYTLGVNYWFAPSLVLKLAYEWWDELGVPSLRDDGFLAQMAWGF